MSACPLPTVKAGQPLTFPLTICNTIGLCYPDNEDFDMNRADERVWITLAGDVIYMHPTALFAALEKYGLNPVDATEVGPAGDRQVLVYVREFEPAKHYFSTRSAAELAAQITPYQGSQPTGFDPATPVSTW